MNGAIFVSCYGLSGSKDNTFKLPDSKTEHLKHVKKSQQCVESFMNDFIICIIWIYTVVIPSFLNRKLITPYVGGKRKSKVTQRWYIASTTK